MDRPMVGLGVFVVKPDGSFLMGQRKGSHGAGSWSVPGGWLEFGESWADCAIREVLEETGLVIKDPVLHVATTNNYFEDEGTHSITVWVKTPWMGGEPKLTEPDKFIGHDWFTLDKLPEPLFMPWQHLLKLDFKLFI